jgi:alpha-tubulin suppressor-like RCC1 family protein
MRSSWKPVALLLFCAALTACPGSDKTPPTVSLTSSTQTVNVGGSSKLSAKAADEGGIKHVEFLEGDKSLSVDTAAPYEFVVSGFTAPGTRGFSARAVDIAGNSADSGVVKVIVNDAGSPVIQSFRANPNPVQVLNDIELEVIASDDVKVTEVNILEGTQELKTFTAEPFKFSLNMNDLNTRTFSVVVKDAAGNSARAELSIKAEDNVAPSVTLTPSVTLENARVIKNSSLSFAVTASDNFALAKLELFVNDSLLSSVSSAPFNLDAVVDTSVLGSQGFRAVATDQAGKTSEVAVAFEVVNPVVQLAAGAQHTCALFANGEVRCWGANGSGQLGRGDTTTINASSAATPVPLGKPAKQIAAGGAHNCALLEDGSVKCWGEGDSGQLGYANSDDVGDDLNDDLAESNPVTIVASGESTKVKQIVAGFEHTCALLENDAVRCWGLGSFGRLGYGNTNSIGDTEAPASAGSVSVVRTGVKVLEIFAGAQHTCALLSSQRVRCWGNGLLGKLGYGDTQDRGDDETPANANPAEVDIVGDVTHMGLGSSAAHTCALRSDTTLNCWGDGNFGKLGYGKTDNIGDDETPARKAVSVGGKILQVVTGGNHTCTLLKSGKVKCWGRSNLGQLGYGNTDSIGDIGTPDTVAEVSISPVLEVTQLTAGQNHTCALLENGNVKCWGQGSSGQLGYGNLEHIGDHEFPSSVGFLSFL